jgi:nitrite reductase/ring-hydroxylating ferredoxin subunit
MASSRAADNAVSAVPGGVGAKQVVCREEDLAPGQMRTLRNGGAPVVVVCSAVGEYHAVRGICPHQGALLGRGHLWSLTVSEEPGVYGLAEKAEILRCPWHSFDYDVTTGRCVSDPRLRVRTYPVSVEDGHIVVDLSKKRP